MDENSTAPDIAGLDAGLEARGDEEIRVRCRATRLVAALVSMAALCSIIGCAGVETARAETVSLVAPDSLGGREKIVRPPNEVDRDGEAAELARLWRAVPTVGNIVMGLYRQGEWPSGLIMMAGTARIEGDLETTLDALIRDTPTNLRGPGGVLTPPTLESVNPVAVDQGPLGGIAKCAGQRRVNDPHGYNYPVAVCAWADRRSVGTVIWPTASVEVARGEFAAMRGEIELVE